MTEEMKRFIELLRMLDFERTKEFFCMIKGAAIVAAKEGK